MFDYPVTLTLDDGSLLVTFVDVPEAITFGAGLRANRLTRERAPNSLRLNRRRRLTKSKKS